MSLIPRSRLAGELLRVALAFTLFMGAVLEIDRLLGDAGARVVFWNAIPPVVELAIGALMFLGGRRMRTTSPRLARAFAIIGVAVGLYAAGDVAWAYLELVEQRPAFPSLADAFYLLYFPVFLAGAMQLISGQVSPKGRSSIRLDLLTVTVAASLVFWNLLIGPLGLSHAGEPRLNQLILFAYPVSDLVLLCALILVVYYQTEELELASTVVLGAAIVLMVMTDSAYAYKTLAGTYESGTLLDAGWLAAHVLTGLAFVPQLRSVLSGKPIQGASAQATHLETLRGLRTYLPYGALLLAYMLLLRGSLGSLPMKPLSLGIGLGIIVALVLLRQMTTLAENSELTAAVLNNAGALENTNRDLAVEVDERKRIEEKLSYDTLHDSMTGLPNRVLFLEMLQRAISLARSGRERSYAVLFIDIDHFKVVNDSLGHMVGDELLWAIGARLKGALRSTDTLARFGGDEFAILMDAREHKDAASRLADRVQKSLQQVFRVEGHELHMSASIGIVGDVAGYEQAEDLLRDADLAMYEAKSMGKSRSESFAVRMRKRAFLRLDLEAELRRALKGNEIQVYYQPILSLHTERVCGLEALVRWQHPLRGLLRPRDFLAVAEESGLILRMGEQVMGTACEEMNRLQERYPELAELGVSVNLSNKQFSRPGLVGTVEDALRRSGLPARSLKLEITERVLIENQRVANRVFSDLNSMGVRLDIDDFGTGYSALGYLQHFPIHGLKIDQSFVEGMRKSRKGLGLVRAIVAMAHELGMQTVAEGIANRAQMSDLVALQCDYGQGMLLARPMTARAIEQFMVKEEPVTRRKTKAAHSNGRTVRKKLTRRSAA
jgi:diguanylate cyclase (GGDEF)-like protein